MKTQVRCNNVTIYLNDEGFEEREASFSSHDGTPMDRRVSIHLPDPTGYFKVGEYYELTLTKVE